MGSEAYGPCLRLKGPRVKCPIGDQAHPRLKCPRASSGAVSAGFPRVKYLRSLLPEVRLSAFFVTSKPLKNNNKPFFKRHAQCEICGVIDPAGPWSPGRTQKKLGSPSNGDGELDMPWHGTNTIESRSYKCGFCDNQVASASGFFTSSGPKRRAFLCPHCDRPSLFDENDKQTPGVAYGNAVQQVPNGVSALYNEARRCFSVGCFTASVLTCRKLLMNIGVEQGAEPGGTFISYVDHLAANGFVPPNGRGWVDHIRRRGNEATHEIHLMTSQDAQDLISFSEMLLKFIYEFPSRVPAASPAS